MLFRTTGPEYLVLAAGRVGGIAANMAAPVEFLVQNLAIQSNVLLSYLEAALRKTVFLGLHPVPDNGKLERLAQTILAFIERPSAAGFPG
jgi:GDP-L-fucose synthase